MPQRGDRKSVTLKKMEGVELDPLKNERKKRHYLAKQDAATSKTEAETSKTSS